MIPEYRAKALLAPAGVPFPQGRLATSADEAVAHAQALGFPVVLKAQAAALSHKSDAGGVIVGLADADAVRAGWARMHADVTRHVPGLALDGILVEAMGARGIELIVGARNDAEWGPVILVGFGGVQAEILKDVRLLVPGLSREAVIAELLQLRSAALLTGWRGQPAARCRMRWRIWWWRSGGCSPAPPPSARSTSTRSWSILLAASRWTR